MKGRSPKISIRRDTLEWRLLSFIEKIGTITADIWLPRSYSSARLWRDFFGINRKRFFDEKEREKTKFLASATLSRLRVKGFIKRHGSRRKAKWQLTKRGKRALDTPIIEPLPEDGKARVVIFDIPEHSRAYRRWLRENLTLAGYLMLQKSVWIGKRPLPEYIFEEIKAQGLFECAHIFEVKEIGSLENLDWRS